MDPIHALALVLAFPAGVGLSSLLAALLGPDAQYAAGSLVDRLVTRGGREYALGALDRLIEMVDLRPTWAVQMIAAVRARV